MLYDSSSMWDDTNHVIETQTILSSPHALYKAAWHAQHASLLQLITLTNMMSGSLSAPKNKVAETTSLSSIQSLAAYQAKQVR